MQETTKITIKEKVISGVKTTGKIFGALARGFVEGAEHYAEAQRKAERLGQAPEIDLPTTVTLGAEQLKQLRGLNSWQLEAMFKGKKVVMDNEPATYAQLKNFNSWQLEAIFGKEDDD